MSLKFGDARMPSLRDKIRAQVPEQVVKEKVVVKKVEKKLKGRRLNK